MDRLGTRLDRLEARYLAEPSTPRLTDAERAALIERVHAAIGEAWAGMTEQERYEAEHRSQPELAQGLADLRTQLEERAEVGAVVATSVGRGGLRP